MSFVLEHLSRFQDSIDKSLQCHEAETLWQNGKYKKKIDFDNYFETLYWKCDSL